MLWRNLTFILVVLAGSVSAFDQISVEASLDVERQVVSGRATYRISARGASYDAMRFRMYPNSVCEEDSIVCGIVVDSVTMDGLDFLEYSSDETDLLVSLDRTVEPDDSLYITLYFQTYIPDAPGRFGVHRGLYNLEAWFPFPAPWRDGEWLFVEYCYLCEPVGEHYTIFVTFDLPDSLTLMAAGVVKKESSESRSTYDLFLHLAQDLALSIASDFEMQQFEAGSVAVKIWHRENRAYAVDTTQALTIRTLEIMSELVGDYPFDELVIVIGGLDIGAALELPRLLWMNQPDAFSFVRMYQTMLVHEVVHQWFFGVVASDQTNEPWLDEATTEYFNVEVNRILFDSKPDFINLFGMTSSYRQALRMASRGAWKKFPITRGAISYSPRRYSQVVYGKGALIMQTLTGLMGEEGGRAFWHKYYEDFKFTRPSPEDFFQTAAEFYPTGDAADVRDLIEITTRPDYAITEVEMRDSTFLIEQDKPSDDTTSPAPVLFVDVIVSFTHPLPTPILLRVEFSDGSIRDTSFVPIAGEQTITLESKSLPATASLDPDCVYAIDANLLNNSIQFNNGAGNGLRLFSGALFLVESLFSSVWGI